MNTRSAAAALCLAVLAAPLSAQSLEEIKTVSDRPPVGQALKVSDVCFGKGRLVAATRESIEKAEKGVASKAMNVGEGVDLVMRNVASDAGAQCVAKTVLADAREKGDLASSITVEDDGRAISVMVATAGGPVLFKGSSEAGAYAFQVLTYRLQRLAQPAAEGRGGCRSGGGKDEDQRACPRHGYVKDGDAEVTGSPAPGGSDERGGKDGDQRSSDRPRDIHE